MVCTFLSHVPHASQLWLTTGRDCRQAIHYVDCIGLSPVSAYSLMDLCSGWLDSVARYVCPYARQSRAIWTARRNLPSHHSDIWTKTRLWSEIFAMYSLILMWLMRACVTY